MVAQTKPSGDTLRKQVTKENEKWSDYTEAFTPEMTHTAAWFMIQSRKRSMILTFWWRKGW
jgi:uncharacterized protein YeaO (DUF488 family)